VGVVSLTNKLGLEEGKEYVVYGIVYGTMSNKPLEEGCWFYLDDDVELMSFHSRYFKIIDNSLSSYWEFAMTDGLFRNAPHLVFKEWAEDSWFYEALDEGDPKAIGLYAKYKIFK